MGRYEDLRAQMARLVEELTSVLEEVAISCLQDVLPGTSRLEILGDFDEDLQRRLRVQRVMGDGGAVLFDITVGHDDPVVEEMIDQVGIEYLDLLIELTGDHYVGRCELNG